MGNKEGVINLGDAWYPEALKAIGAAAPKKLFYKGALNNALFERCLSVVGSRKLTSYGRRATEQIVSEAAAAGITIVSGFMYGGDEAAHAAAIKSGGKTIAVMPCGINVIHPPQHKQLHADILDNGGLILSEYESDFQPQTWSYVQRDRVVAALSAATFVTEAAENSGSLLTANYAKKFGRKLFALPGPITSTVSRGTNMLIKEGAEPVLEANDILSFFKVTAQEKSVMRQQQITTANSLEEKILDQLRRESLKADDMARALAIPISKLGTALSLMQLKGIINQDQDKYYVN